jgi:hypothetical protein
VRWLVEVDGAHAARVSAVNTNKKTFMASVYLILGWLEGYLYIHSAHTQYTLTTRHVSWLFHKSKSPQLGLRGKMLLLLRGLVLGASAKGASANW